uniref:Poly [ADP-ribose] polymerase n=1 Tax=Heterorhabditis bacteriophora TaxID=37862 RepID=A0A1I7XGW6_HETBA
MTQSVIVYGFVGDELGIEGRRLYKTLEAIWKLRRQFSARNFLIKLGMNGLIGLILRKFQENILSFMFHQPPLIKTTEGLKKETELLEVLADIEVAIRTLGKGRTKGDSRPAVDRYYENMCCHIKPVESNEYEYKMIERYLKNTHGRTHLYKMKLRNVFAVEKDDEKVAFMEDVGNRSAIFLSTTFPYNLLWIFQVALGNSQRLYDADYNADNLSKVSIDFTNKWLRNPFTLCVYSSADGVRVPLGIPVDNEERNSPYSLIYNEYVVYNTAQVKMRYVVEVEFDMCDFIKNNKEHYEVRYHLEKDDMCHCFANTLSNGVAYGLRPTLIAFLHHPHSSFIVMNCIYNLMIVLVSSGESLFWNYGQLGKSRS